MTALNLPRKVFPRRLLTVGHSFTVRANRRLAEAINDAANGCWEVTVAAPSYYKGNPRYGDLRPEKLTVQPDERLKVVGLPVALTDRVHFSLYGPRLRSLLHSGFDAVHCWEEPYVLSCSQMVRWAPREAIVTVSSWQNINKSYPPPFNWLERSVLKRCDGWIAGATLVEQALENRPIYRDRPHRVIGYGVDPNQFRPDSDARASIRRTLNWTDDEIPVIGFLGRFTKPKGLSLLLKALDQVKSPWRALFIGGGALEDELRFWSRQYGSRVRILPPISNDAIPMHLNAIDILCVPSQTTPIWREQFGRVLVEALACGICVIASDSGEIPYVVGDAGHIVSENDVEKWSHAIERFLHNSSGRHALGRRGIARVNSRYTWRAIGRKYVDFLDHLCRERGKSRVRPRSSQDDYSI